MKLVKRDTEEIIKNMEQQGYIRDETFPSNAGMRFTQNDNLDIVWIDDVITHNFYEDVLNEFVNLGVSLVLINAVYKIGP